jgi:hypothetical protein
MSPQQYSKDVIVKGCRIDAGLYKKVLSKKILQNTWNILLMLGIQSV